MQVKGVAVPVALMACLCSEPALAFEEQWHLGGGLGALNTSAAAVGLGLGADAYASYDLNDMFDLRIDLVATTHAVEFYPGYVEQRTFALASFGATYKIDVIDWVPYFGADVGYLMADLPEGLGLEPRSPVLGGVLGLDYVVTPAFALGIVNRYHAVLGEGSLVDLFLRAEYRWDN